ncbi:MAG: pyridoxal phosphate-dependent aminotransferase [Desulfohalobiaceae bacterium]
MQLAKRMQRLGTETAFSVSAEAAQHAAQGNTVYPFHLGDLNLATPSSVVQGAVQAIEQGKTGYCPNAGIPELRQALAEEVNSTRGTGYSMENVAVQPGGKPVISKFLLSLMNPGDEVLYPNPGFPIYESQIEFLGGRAVPYPYLEQGGRFSVDLEELQRLITAQSKLIIVNDMHNPTGAMCSRQELQRLAQLIKDNDLFVLLDEAYFDICYAEDRLSLAGMPGMQERCLMLYTFSKKFAMTGWRLGAALGPEELIQGVTRLNVNQESCSNHFVQYGALAGLKQGHKEAEEIVQRLRRRRDTAVDLLRQIPGVSCSCPESTFYLYPNVTGLIQAMGTDLENFRRQLLQETGVSACARHHFGRPLPGEDQAYLRLAYSGISQEGIKSGLQAFKEFAEKRG